MFSNLSTKYHKVITSNEFGILFLKYRDKFISIARSYTRDATVAEDIVAEAFTNFWDNRDKIELQTIPEAYILQSVRNRCLNFLRDRETKLRIEHNIQDNAFKALITEINILNSTDMGMNFSADIADIFKKQLNSMPEMMRKVFFASRFEDMTYQEIADRYGISQRKVKREIQNALSILRHSLKDYLPLITLIFPGLGL